MELRESAPKITQVSLKLVSTIPGSAGEIMDMTDQKERAMHDNAQADLREAESLYDRYVRPLESDHRGEYVAVSKDHGKVVLAPTLLAAMEKAEKEFGAGTFLFKVGNIATDSWL
jgi:hypothetical protein